jgi:antitoxin component YwqK of YwqJK toxin-antitoxin module
MIKEEENVKYRNPEELGETILYYSDGSIEYVGQVFFSFFSNVVQVNDQGLKNGYGKMYHSNQNLKFEGGFAGGLFEGLKCGLYWSNGNLMYSGGMKGGRKEGGGIWYHENGRLRFEGDWKNDGPHGGVTIYKRDGNIGFIGDMDEGVNEYDQSNWRKY